MSRNIINQSLDLLMPNVLIDIIYSFALEPYLIVSKLILSRERYYIIDNIIYTHEYNKYKSLPNYKNIDQYCDKDDHILSFKHKLTMHKPYFRRCDKYHGNIKINDINITSFLPTTIQIQLIHDHAIYNDELYICVRETNVSSIYKINLCTTQCEYVVQLPHGYLFVSESYVVVWSMCDKRILHIYNKRNKQITQITHYNNIIYHITDHFVYGLIHSNRLQITLLMSPDDIIDDIQFENIHFNKNTFYIIRYKNVSSICMHIYNIIE
jgi:hypothetical protein